MEVHLDAYRREERLAAAKKKLREFRLRHHNEAVLVDSSGFSFRTNQQRPLSATFSVCSTESIAESSKSMDHRLLSAHLDEEDENYNSSRFPIDTNSCQFSHDDARSPFERVIQKPSQQESEELGFNGNHLEAESETVQPSDLTPKLSRSRDYVDISTGAKETATRPTLDNSIYLDSKEINSHARMQPVQDTSDATAYSNFMKLKEENDYLRQFCSHITAEFEELNRNYANLHAAYSNLASNHSNRSVNNSNEILPDDVSQEVIRLKGRIDENMQTLSVIIEEKSDLQSQLRQAMEIANSKNCENEELVGRLKETKNELSDNQRQLEIARSAKRALEASFEHQTEELVRLRQEWAQSQAKLSESLQDKSEAQAKLKLRLKECDALQKTLHETQQRLTANEIYVRQLTGGAASLPNVESASVQNDPQVEIDRLKADLNEWNRAYDSLKWENDNCKQRFEVYSRQLNDKLAELIACNEKLSDDKSKLEKLSNDLQEQLSVCLNNSREKTPSDISEDLGQAALVELDKLKVNYQHARNERDAFVTAVEQKDSMLLKLEEALAEKDRKISELNEYLNAVTLTDSNTKSLLEQLHNEKAASSRSIAQNLALKTQLAELEDKFVAVTNDQMECASSLQTAQYSVVALEKQLAEKTEEFEALTKSHADECKQLKEQVNSIMRHEYDRRQLEDRLQHYEAAYKAATDELAQLKSHFDNLLAENASLRNRFAASDMQRIENGIGAEPVNETVDLVKADSVYRLNREPQPNVDYYGDSPAPTVGISLDANSEIEISSLKAQLLETTQIMRRVSAENAELHRIMDQNSMDENQNNIRVEFNRAVERLGLLADENEHLRRTVADLNSQDKQLAFHEKYMNDDISSICSEQADQKRDVVSTEAFENLKTSMEQLQERLKRAMDQNADLSDQNENLEHLIVKLQSETETIGEYVTLYRHQRQLIRDKLKEKEQHVAHLSHENNSIQAKLSELQDLVINLMKERGTLVSYVMPDRTPSRQPPPHSPPSKLSPKPHSLNETLVDEVSDSGELRQKSSSPCLSTETACHAEVKQEVQNYSSVIPAITGHVVSNFQRSSSEEPSNEGMYHSGTADRILQILSELQKPDFSRNLKPYERDLHCKHCTGHMITL